MLRSFPCVLLITTAAILPAANPSLFIAPVAQSSLVAYNASILTPVSGYSVGGNAKALVLSSDGKSAFVTATAEGAVKQIDLSTGNLLQTYSTGPNPVALGLSPDGTELYVLTSASTSYLYAFNTGTGAQTGKVPAGYQSISLAVSPDGKKIYVASSKILDFDSSTLAISSTIPVAATGLTFGPSSQVLYALTIEADQQIQVISTKSDAVTATISTSLASVYALAVSGDGASLYAASTRGLIWISASTHQTIEVFDQQRAFFAVALSPDGSAAVCAGTVSVSINLKTAASQPVGVNGAASGVVFAPAGGQFYVLLNTAYDVDYVNLSTDQVSGAVTGVPGNYILAASLSGNKIGAIYSGAGKFSLIDATSHTVDKTYAFVPSQGLAGLALNSTGTVALFPTGSPSVLETLDLVTGKSTKVPIPNSAPDIYAAVSPDDKTAYVLGQQLCMVDIASDTVTKCGPTIALAYTGLLRALVLDSTGTRIFAIGASTVGEYDAASLQLLQTASLPSGESAVGITYSAATNSVYVIATNTITATGAVARIDATSFTVVATAATASLLSDIAVSPDGKQVYLAGYTNGIPILDGTTLAPTGSVAKIRASSVVSTP